MLIERGLRGKPLLYLLFRRKLVLGCSNNGSNSTVTGHVACRSAHVKDAIDTKDQRDARLHVLS